MIIISIGATMMKTFIIKNKVTNFLDGVIGSKEIQLNVSHIIISKIAIHLGQAIIQEVVISK